MGLGTVQFGVDYGISNKTGKTSPEEVRKILSVATENGISLLDTAAMYGDSEEVLGGALRDVKGEFDIITKSSVISSGSVTNEDVEKFEAVFNRSLQRLQVSSIEGLLVHQVDDLFKPGGERLVEKLKLFQSSGLVRKVGISVYSGQQIDQVLAMFKPDIIQLPVNVFDQRLIHSGHLTKLKKLDVEIHARSIFLQGLLLMEFNSVPRWFSSVLGHIRQYHEHLKANGLSLLQGAMQFVNQLKEIDVGVVGVNSTQHLMQVIKAFEALPEQANDMSRFSISDPLILNPACWKVDA